jgi:hypothetical protein
LINIQYERKMCSVVFEDESAREGERERGREGERERER